MLSICPSEIEGDGSAVKREMKITIGKTVYIIQEFFTGKESVEEVIRRMIQQDIENCWLRHQAGAIPAYLFYRIGGIENAYWQNATTDRLF